MALGHERVRPKAPMGNASRAWSARRANRYWTPRRMAILDVEDPVPRPRVGDSQRERDARQVGCPADPTPRRCPRAATEPPRDGDGPGRSHPHRDRPQAGDAAKRDPVEAAPLVGVGDRAVLVNGHAAAASIDAEAVTVSNHSSGRPNTPATSGVRPGATREQQPVRQQPARHAHEARQRRGRAATSLHPLPRGGSRGNR